MNYFIIITRKLFTFLLVLSATFQLLASPVALAYENTVENATVIIVVAQSISEDKERNKAFQNGKVLKDKLEKRLIIFTCGTGGSKYPGTTDPKLRAWVLTKQAECAAYAGNFDVALQKLEAATAYTKNLESRFLLLQINFQKENYNTFVKDFKKLIDAVTDDKWPTLTSEGLLLDPHFVIQELRRRLTPNLFVLLNDMFATQNPDLDKYIIELINYINYKGGCQTIISNVLSRIDDYNVLIHTEGSENAVGSETIETYIGFSNAIKDKLCPKLDRIEKFINDL